MKNLSQKDVLIKMYSVHFHMFNFHNVPNVFEYANYAKLDGPRVFRAMKYELL